MCSLSLGTSAARAKRCDDVTYVYDDVTYVYDGMSHHHTGTSAARAKRCDRRGKRGLRGRRVWYDDVTYVWYDDVTYV